MFTVRYVTQADKAFWYTLDAHLSQGEFEPKVRDGRGYIILCGALPIGILRYNLFWDSIPFLTLIFLDERFRGRGAGTMAVRFWESEMRALGHAMVMTSTQVDEAAQHFYRKLGYTDSGALFLDQTPFDQPLELLMIKILDE